MSGAGPNLDEPIWRPAADRIARSQMREFHALAEQRTGRHFADYRSLHAWSIDDSATFWALLADYAGVDFARCADRILKQPDQMPGARWFVGAELNFAAQLLRFADDRPAIIFRDETGRRRELSHADLRVAVAGAAGALRESGIVAGDRVAGLLPNCPEAVIAMLAATSIGAVWSSCSPDFGPQGVVDRFGQIEPRILFAADGYRYAGKIFLSGPAIAEVMARVPSIERLVLVPFLGEALDPAASPGAVAFDAFSRPAGDAEFVALPFDHPLYILFSSGTTGAPKCIVHGAGGTLLQHLKEHLLHTDLSAADRLFYFTTCGWMMWNWLASALATGAAIVLYDGSPFHPDPGVLWRIAEEESVTVFGTSPRYLSALEKSGYRPAERNDTRAIRTVLSTGAPLAPASFDFTYAAIGSDLQLSSIAGGTDLISCFALGNPLLPVYRGELQCLGLGMAVDIFDETGASLAGGRGELVCTRPFPSMPVGFWNDADGARYRDAYFQRFPGVWAHGDFAELTPRGGLVIHGRSDAVLNPGGVRIGTAEIYRQVDKLEEVVESIAVGQQWQGDTRVVLFVVLRDGLLLDDVLQERIRSTIRGNATPRHVPAKIIAVPDIPRTRSGKSVELAVRAVIHGEPVENTEALANPEALDYFDNQPELAED